METHSFEPFQSKHPLPPKECRGVDIKRTPLGCVSQLLKISHSQGYVRGYKGG